MALILAVVMGLILLMKVSSDKANHRVYQQKQEQKNRQLSDTESHYTNKALENAIWNALKNEQNTDNIRREVELALSCTKYWNTHMLLLTYSDTAKLNGKWWTAKRKTEKLHSDRQLARDILLANRGFVSNDAWWWGYNAYLQYNDGLLKNKQFELVELICRTLRKQNIHLTPVYLNGPTESKYAWIGSRAESYSNSEKQPFSRDLVNPPVVNIPKPYYDK